jgi:hypothetical protein
VIVVSGNDSADKLSQEAALAGTLIINVPASTPRYVLARAAFIDPSEYQLQCELDLTRYSSYSGNSSGVRIANTLAVRDCGKQRRIGVLLTGDGIVRMIEDVEELRAELHQQLFGDLRVLPDRNIRVVEAWTNLGCSSQIAQCRQRL